MKKLLPSNALTLTIVCQINKAKSEALGALFSLCVCIFLTLVILMLVATGGSWAGFWFRILPAILFSILCVLLLWDTYKKVKVLADVATDAAKKYESESYARMSAEFDSERARVRSETSRRSI